MMSKRCAIWAGALASLLAGASGASAEPDLFSRQAFEGAIDLRAIDANGQPSFLTGGFGRTRFGGDGPGDRARAALAEAELIWKPQLAWAVGAVVDVEHQQGQQHAIDLSEAYLTLRPTPTSTTRFSARAGLYYPPISQEHEGPGWDVVNTITPSAINSWVGEEVKVLGGEAKVTRRFGGHELSGTFGVFGLNDTSGTLLTFRGWGLQDVKATAFGKFRLPPLDDYMTGLQPPFTSPVIELDHRIGYYARADWRPPGRFAFNAFYYDNRGDKVSDNADLQWAWDTRFWNFGASWDVDDHTRVLSQVLTGHSLMGYPNGRSVWINLDFTSAYLLATRSIGPSGFTGRVDYFETRDRNFEPGVDDGDDNRGETGWALTAAYRLQVSQHAQLKIEALHVHSRRPGLEAHGLAPVQDQTELQTALRFGF